MHTDSKQTLPKLKRKRLVYKGTEYLSRPFLIENTKRHQKIPSLSNSGAGNVTTKICLWFFKTNSTFLDLPELAWNWVPFSYLNSLFSWDYRCVCATMPG